MHTVSVCFINGGDEACIQSECVLLMVVMRHAYSQRVCFINGGDEACIQSECVFINGGDEACIQSERVFY